MRLRKSSNQSQVNLTRAQAAAVRAARAVGVSLRRHLHSPKRANLVTSHDIKLELDVQSQARIERTLRAAFPRIGVLGEEGEAGDTEQAYRWVVDPIDGTVNFAYTIPHACVSIALQGRAERPGPSTYQDGYETLVGVVYDPFCDELWTAIRGGPARLNGRVIHVSQRRRLSQAIASMGFAKSRADLEATLPCFIELSRRVRKMRMMGAAALALTYVATGRFDAYIERGIRLWDIAAGGLIVECAGGKFWREAVGTDRYYRMVASNARLHNQLARPQ